MATRHPRSHRTMGWGIATMSREGHGLLGRRFFTQNDDWPLGGYNIATFPTREDARRALAKMKRQEYQAFPDARVVRLRIETIWEE